MVESLLTYEWQAISQLVYRINRCRNYEEFSRTVLEQIRTMIPFTQGMIFKASRINQKIVLSHANAVPERSEEYLLLNKYLTGNYEPKWLHYLNSPWSCVVRYFDILTDKSWDGLPLYHEILQPQELYYAIYMTYVHRDQALGAIAIWRKKSEEDFSDRELYILEILKIHIELKFYYLSNFQLVPMEQTAGAQRTAIGEFSEAHGLTKREFEILQLLNDGKNNAEICSQLYISDSTLRKHIHNIYQKIGVRNRMQLVQKMKAERNP